MTTAKNEVFIELQHGNFLVVANLTLVDGGIKIWWGSLLGGIFPGDGGREQIFG